MDITQTALDGIVLITPDVFADERGYFYESFNEEKYRDMLGGLRFVQDNISRSILNTVRGLHYQVGRHAQGKLCQVLKGHVIDVAVDIRFGSPTFGKYFAAELSEHNHSQLWIPPGFAHGFSVLSEEAIFHYKCTAPYHKASERAIRFDDPNIAIDWKIHQAIVSAKDVKASAFQTIEKDFELMP